MLFNKDYVFEVVTPWSIGSLHIFTVGLAYVELLLLFIFKTICLIPITKMYRSWNARLTKLREAQRERSSYFTRVNQSIINSEPHQTVLQGIHLNNFQKPTSTSGSDNLNFDFTSYNNPAINEAFKIYKALVHAKACSNDLTEISVNFVVNYMHAEMNFEV